MNATRTRTAFTMVELMVVMLILTVLAAMVVALGHYTAQKQHRELTRTQQQIIMEALQQYVAVYGTAPDVPMSPPYPISRLDGMSNEEYYIYARINMLYEALKGVPSCENILQELPEGSETQGSLEDPGAFVDAYGNYMDYQPTGGMGGAPVLISGGPDGYIGGEHEADDIRSD
jgi:prepilin-type N-terminal cleavage/methylation domain-containing protein